MHQMITKLEQTASHIIDAPQTAHAVGVGTASIGFGGWFDLIPETVSKFGATFGVILTCVLIWRHIRLTQIAVKDSARRDKDSLLREIEHHLTIEKLQQELSESRAAEQAIKFKGIKAVGNE